MTATKPGRHQRPNLTGMSNIDRSPIMNPSTGRSLCPDGTAHRWLLDTPSGSSHCRGECKKCGLVRGDFRTSCDEISYGDLTSGGDAFRGRQELREARRQAAS